MVAMAIEQAAIGANTPPLTYRDLEGMPDDGRFYELSNGALVVTPSANLRHQDLAFRIGQLLDRHRRPDQAILIEAELRIREDMVKWPDVQVVDRSLLVGQAITGTPALVVEVTSPSTSLLDRTEKRAAYAEAGIPGYWLVDPDARTITVLELAGADYVEVAVLDAAGRAGVAVPTTFGLDAAAIFA
jgi:Uma2 family endonuclease